MTLRFSRGEGEYPVSRTSQPRASAVLIQFQTLYAERIFSRMMIFLGCIGGCRKELKLNLGSFVCDGFVELFRFSLFLRFSFSQVIAGQRDR